MYKSVSVILVASMLLGAPMNYNVTNMVDITYYCKDSESKWQKIKDKVEDTTENVKESTQEAVEDAKETADKVGDKAKKKTSEIADKAKETGEVVSDKAKETGKKVSDKAKETGEVVSEKAKETGKKVSEKTKETTEIVSEKAKETGKVVSEKAGQAKDAVVEGTQEAVDSVKLAISKIDPDTFKKGWDYAAEFFGAQVAARMTDEYMKSVQKAITDMQKDINAEAGVTRGISQEAGFVAEKWHADTYNIDSVVKKAKSTAKQLQENGHASVDVATSEGDNASLKYYKNAKGSAKAQAKNLLQDYKEYEAKAKSNGTANILSFDEYLNKNYSATDIPDLYDSVYSGQKRIIPSDQLEDAKEYLTKKINKEKINRPELVSGYQDTLDNLADRMTSKDGVSSKPLTYEDAQAIAELCEKGDFDPSDFGITLSDVVTPKYVVKQAIGSGVESGVLEAAMTVGPELYGILKELAQTGNIDEEELKEVGINSLLAGSNGFVEGSVSSALFAACKAGKFGPEMTDASPDVIGALTVIAIDSMKYGYKLSKGEITSEDFADIMTEEIFVSLISVSTGMTVALLLPGVPFAYMAGSMAGSILGSYGYELGKEIVLECKDAAGYGVIIPEKVVAGINIGKENVAKLNLKEKWTDFKSMIVSTTKDGKIKLKMA